MIGDCPDFALFRGAKWDCPLSEIILLDAFGMVVSYHRGRAHMRPQRTLNRIGPLAIIVAAALHWAQAADDEPKTETVTVPGGNAVEITIPKDWDFSKKPLGNTGLSTLALESSDKTTLLQITMMPDLKGNFSTKEGRDKVLTEAAQHFVDGSVEKKIELQQVESKNGQGSYAKFTDASLVGKPAQAGQYQAMATGIMLFDKSAATFTLLSDSFDNKTYAAGMDIMKNDITALADTASIPIPNQGWHISLDAPAFDHKQGQQQGRNYVYQATSDRFNLSIFVEPQAKAGGSKECYEYYWPKASRNPLISKPTIKTSNTDKYYRVEYDVDAGPIKQRNVNYYFMFDGKWVDVHISITNPTKDDDGVITKFDKGLSYGK